MKMKTNLDYFSRHFRARTILLLNLFSGVISQKIGDVRLVDGDGGTGSNQGRVEVYSDAGRRQMVWARLCDTRWDMNVASVVCRQLGFDDVQRFYSSPSSGTGTQRVIRLDRCMRNTDAATLNEAGCRIMTGGRTCNNKPDASVSCLTLPRTPLPPLDNQNPTPVVIATDGQTTSNRMTSIHPMPTTRMMSTSSGKSTTSTIRTTASTSTTTNVDTVTGDWMTMDATVTGIRLPRKNGRNIAAISGGVSLICFIIAIIVIIIFLRHRCTRKSTHTKSTATHSQQGPGDRENNFPDNEYQYTAVGTVENGQTEPRIPSNITVDDYQYSPIGPSLDNGKDVKAGVPKQESVDEYEYSAVGPIQSGTEIEARIPKQESIDEYQYSAVGPIYNDAHVEPRVPKQDSVDEYQYSAVGPIQNDSDVEPRVHRQDSDDESFYAPVGATSSDTLTPKSTAFANVCTDESLYTIPDRSDVNPYQELTVTTSTFAGLQKLKKKLVLEQSAPRAPEVNVAKHPPGKPRKPIKKPFIQTDDNPAQKPGIPHQPTELDNGIYGLEVIGAPSAADGKTDDQRESIYANDIELRKLSPSNPSSIINKDSTIIEENVIKDGENPYENSIIGDESFLQHDEDSAYHALSRKATLPV